MIISLIYLPLKKFSSLYNMCDAIKISLRLDDLLKIVGSHADYDEIHDSILELILDELKEVVALQKDVEKYRKLVYTTEANYMNVISELKKQMDEERRFHEADLEDKWESIRNMADINAMKKYQPAKFEKVKLDVEFSSSMCDLKNIKF